MLQKSEHAEGNLGLEKFVVLEHNLGGMLISTITNQHSMQMPCTLGCEAVGAAVEATQIGLRSTSKQHPCSRLHRKPLCVELARHHAVVDLIDELPAIC